MVENISDVNVNVRNDIFDSLDDLGYDGPLLKTDVFEKAVDEGLVSIDFTSLVQWIVAQLNSFAGLDEHIQTTTGLEDTDNFLMELSGFLREFGCPYKSLTEGLLQQRFASKDNRLLLLDYLLTELQAAQINSHKHPKLTKTGIRRENSHAYEQIQDLMIRFGVSEEQDDLSTTSSLFAKLSEKISHCLSSVPSGYASKPMFSSVPSEDDWSQIEYISQALKQDYNCRREMIIQRLDVTMQSFSWSEKIENNKEQLSCLYHSARAKMTSNSDITVAHLLAARDDILQVEKTCGESARERTKCGINQVMIGAVPDRGGRPYELDRPPPEMPAFQQRRPQKGNQDNRRPYQQQFGNLPNAKRRR